MDDLVTDSFLQQRCVPASDADRKQILPYAPTEPIRAYLACIGGILITILYSRLLLGQRTYFLFAYFGPPLGLVALSPCALEVTGLAIHPICRMPFPNWLTLPWVSWVNFCWLASSLFNLVSS